MKKGHNLNFDSDEERDGNELISLDDNKRDRTSTAAEKIPKLKKPEK